MTQIQININTPQGVTAPKFHLFQRVSFNQCGCYNRRKVSTRRGVITGIEYVAFTDALVRNLNNHGWCYTINFLCDMDEQRLLEVDEDRAVQEAWEADLVAEEGGDA